MGFKLASSLVWVSGRGERGDYWRTAHLMLALGVRGVLPFRNKSPLSWIRVDAAILASKPEVVRELIERVSPGPYLELFGNKPVPGWTVLAHAAGQSNPQ